MGGATLGIVVTIELFGIPRLRAGFDTVGVEASCIGEALKALGRICPALEPAVIEGGRLGPTYVIALNGARITADPAIPLCHGDSLVLLSAEAGG